MITGTGFLGSVLNKKSEIYVDQYRQAVESKNCLMLWSLSQNEDFHLRDLALIRSYELCPQDHKTPPTWSEFPPWLHKVALQVLSQYAKQSGDTKNQIEAYVELSKISTDYDEKTQYMLQAIRSAQQEEVEIRQALQARLYRLSPSRHPVRRYSLEGARDYKKRNLFRQSIWVFRKILNSKTTSISDKVVCFQNLIALYKKTHNRKRQIIASNQYGFFLKKHLSKNRRLRIKYFENQINLARRYWTNGNSNYALKILYYLKKVYPSTAPLDRIYWIRGKIFEEKTNYKKAISEFQLGLKLVQNKEIKAKLLWSLFWNARILKNWNLALTYIDQLIENSKDFSSKYAFWKAQTLSELQKHKESQKVYKEIIDHTPFDFHGMLAHHHAHKVIQLNPKKIHLSYDSVIDTLIAMNEKDLALSFLQYQMRKHKKDSNRYTKEHSIEILIQMARSGAYLPLFKFIGNLDSEKRNKYMEKYAHYLFPKIFNKEVEEAVQKFKSISPLVYSIIRQESAFNKKARSPANAVGLMQVLPNLARRVAQRNTISMKRTKDLYRPRTNILIGTAHLSSLFKKYGNSIIVNAAIYNAGIKPVQKWIREIDSTNPVEFIQNIPYRETRIYVKLIIRNYIFYSLLDHPKHKMHFPKWILNVPKEL